ncbi:HNH endonuclease signature motif containing protein [Luteipulveratus flavus]|uniref:DUF222 domain-containing protein n=1 Tax=Luteipulveratus flavus TaxID=3031728 RepID=A0ABT6C7S8_9MICO|nr:HNH endonuclease signature motif containing protein [Luteipulveratus sp. YIM 133296]MDF8264935.1 DUF222 domain-containing protein [Luteipulveratus sp. YIM 133296]
MVIETSPAAVPGRVSAVVRGAPTALGALSSVLSRVDHAGLWALSGAALEELLVSAAAVRAALDRVEVAAVREGLARGLPAEHGYGAVDWVRRCQQRAGGAAVADPAHVARLLRVAATAERDAAQQVWQQFATGHLSLGKADQVARFEREMSPIVSTDDAQSAVADLVRAASDSADGTGLTPRGLRTAIRYAGELMKPEPALDAEHDARARARSLVKQPGPAGLCEYRLLLDPDGSAVVDAAVAALSAPVPGPHGEPDPRSAALRRADALVEVVRRGVSSPGAAPKTSKAQVVVTMTLGELLSRMPAAQPQGAGVTATGEVLSASEVRRHACDAGIVPMVLGSAGEVLDVGAQVRLFTTAQRLALWRRDRGCSYPGCTIPAQWCDAHHVVWWSRGGPTDLSNAALLCGRHHTVVHRRDLAAQVTPTGVVWDLVPGSGAGPPWQAAR